MAEQKGTIKKVFLKREGESSRGEWKIFDIYFHESEDKFSYFAGEKSFIPKKGDYVSYTFEKERNGKYVNLKIKKMKKIASEGNVEAPKIFSSSTRDNPLWFVLPTAAKIYLETTTKKDRSPENATKFIAKFFLDMLEVSKIDGLDEYLSFVEGYESSKPSNKDAGPKEPDEEEDLNDEDIPF